MNRVIEAWKATGSIKGVARSLGVSYSAAKKLLISARIVEGPHTAEIAALRAEGYTTDQIAAKIGISHSQVCSEEPYTKGSYVVCEKSRNAQRIARCRRNKKK